MLQNVTWICKSCGLEQDNETPHRQFMGEEYCSECDQLLTKRTGGGQSDPFNWTFKIKTLT